MNKRKIIFIFERSIQVYLNINRWMCLSFSSFEIEQYFDAEYHYSMNFEIDFFRIEKRICQYHYVKSFLLLKGIQ